MFYHMGESRHTQNIQINKVFGENEKCVFYFMGKTSQTFWPTQHFVEEVVVMLSTIKKTKTIQFHC